MADIQPQPPGIPLPSQSSAAAVVGGDVSALPTMMLHLVGRAAIISASMAVFGERDPKRLIGGSLAGAAGIEFFVVIHELINRRA
jgi:hypothetical protein